MRDEFERWAGRPPAGLWWAPGRVNVIGEHTDYNDGFVLPFAIELGVTAAAAPRDDGELRFRSLQREEGAGDWLRYPEGVAWSLREEGIDLRGCDVLLDATVPPGAGLSSSAALEVAVALALLGVSGEEIDRLRLAEACRRAEEHVAGVPCGIMDQMAALFGRAEHALLIDTRTLDVEEVPLASATEGLAFVAVDTGAPHDLREGAYAERRRECEEAAAELGLAALRDATPADLGRLSGTAAKRARHVVTENARVLDAAACLRAGEGAAVGPLLTASHASLRTDFEVSSPQLDLAVEAALSAGALGARMVGGGFGGSVLALVEEASARDVGKEAEPAFAEAGFPPPTMHRVRPVDGARRIG